MSLLKNKIALITGGSSGIGLATAKRFIAEDAQVVIAGRGQGQLDAALQELGPAAMAVRADVTKLSDLDHLMNQIKERHGRLDILFANAGGDAGRGPKLFHLTTEEDYEGVFNLNVKGVLFTVQKSLPLLVDGGSIVLTSSIANVKGVSSSGVYGAAKAAVRSFARTLTSELKDRRIRVNAVSPGPTDTPLHNNIGKNDPAVARMVEEMVEFIPVRRLGRPEEIAAAVTFLASDEATFITGIELSVDGGMTQV